jgi:ribonuclease T
MEQNGNIKHPLSRRFRGFLPVIVDVETGGFNAQTDALLEIAAVTVTYDDNHALVPDKEIGYHTIPFEGSNIEKAAIDFNGIDPFHPLRPAIEEADALQKIFQVVRKSVKEHDCTRAILVGHNPAMDLAFLNAAVERVNSKRNPFHPFSTFDTATLGGLAYGQTVLARAIDAADIEWENDRAHSAIYDAQKTAELFCNIVNRWDQETLGINSLARNTDIG